MSDAVGDTYRSSFSSKERAEQYDCEFYNENTYGSLLWEMEKESLSRLVEEFRADHSHIDYLDFASGTGRILSFMEPFVDTATGIDISEAMTERAREKVAKAVIHCKDVTSGDDEIEGKYDLITTFRFVLNAEPALRVTALKSLASRLKDESSWIVFNNSSNLWSHKLLFLPYHKLRSIGKGHVPYGHYLTNATCRRMADEAGLRIARTIGYGFLGGRFCERFAMDRSLGWERKLARSKVLQPFCCNQLYVAKLKN